MRCDDMRREASTEEKRGAKRREAHTSEEDKRRQGKIGEDIPLHARPPSSPKGQP